MDTNEIPEWIASALSGEQLEPFSRSDPNASILAAAGSGKTRTLVHLLAADLAAGIPASGIIAFTFTEKAAEELSARIHTLAKQHLPDVNLAGMYIGTIHAWCLQYLVAQTDFHDFAPLDELQVDALVSRLYDALSLEEAYQLPYPKAIDKFLVDLEVFYNECLRIDQVPHKVRSPIGEFLATLERNRLLTFGGMVRYATKHLQTNGSVTGLISLYVDEYQDVNPAQVGLIRAMVPPGAKLVVVGDDLQCIYNWRGSDVARILHFWKEFAPASVHRLSTNYRSRPSVVVLSNKVAENVLLRDPLKVMKPSRSDPPIRATHWISLGFELAQAEALADIVQRFAAEGTPLSKMAVLLRSVVGSGQPIVHALEVRGIPVQCSILSRGGRFINDFLIPIFDWLRREHRPPKNVEEEAEAEERARNLWNAVERWASMAKSEDAFWDALNNWREAIDNKQDDAYDLRGRLYDLLDLCGVRIAPDDPNLVVGIGIASQIIRSVEEVHRRRIRGQDRRTPRGLLTEAYFALQRKQRDFGESVPIDTTVDSVLVTTVHQAKGLEWPVVILPMLVNRRFPVSSRRHESSYPDDIAGRYGTSIEDERRLFYVAVTRARERLFLLDSALNDVASRSTFLEELQSTGAIEAESLSQLEPAVFRLDKEDLRCADAPPLRVGLSDLLLYLECPYQFALRRMAGVQPSIGQELGFGKGLHELVRRRFEARCPWSSDELAKEVDIHVNLPYMSTEGENRSKRTIERRMKGLENLGVFTAEAESEMPVELVLKAGIIHGVIDNVYVKEDGSLLVRDWKSTVHASFVVRYERQLQFYTYALRQQGRVVSGADIVDVAASCDQNRLVATPVNVDETSIERLISKFNDSLKGIAAGKFPANPDPMSCACCDMYRICAGRYKNDTSNTSWRHLGDTTDQG